MSKYKKEVIPSPGLLTASSIFEATAGRMLTVFSFYLSRDTIDERRYTMFSYKYDDFYSGVLFYRDFFYSDERIIVDLQ